MYHFCMGLGGVRDHQCLQAHKGFGNLILGVLSLDSMAKIINISFLLADGSYLNAYSTAWSQSGVILK